MNDSYHRGRHTGQAPRSQDSRISYYAGVDDLRRARGLKPYGVVSSTPPGRISKIITWTIFIAMAAGGLYALAKAVGL